MVTADEASKIYDQHLLKPSVFFDTKEFQGTSCELLGEKLNSPICISSSAFHKMAHPDGEEGTFEAAQKAGQTCVTLSNWATTTAEDCARQAPDCFKIFQVYCSKYPEVNADMWRRVRESGYKAMALTCDT